MTFGIAGNTGKSGLTDAVAPLLARLEQSGASFVLEKGLAEMLRAQGIAFPPDCVRELEECATATDMLVAFGGDGTILAAARLVGDAGTPILGVNLGKLGFLAELAPGELNEAIGEILAGQYAVEQRLLLTATISAEPEHEIYALNDVVVDKARSSRMINVGVYIDDAFAVMYRGDGLIISTPTGSTGYALSSGGPIVIPTSSVIGITPVSPHTLSGRPLIVPDSSVIRIEAKAHMDEVLISVDGQEEAVRKPPVSITIRKAKHTAHLVKRTGRSYFDVLRAKLLWGKDAREVDHV
jgi:NAD+ kinase